jgi:hypothetical protein
MRPICWLVVAVAALACCSVAGTSGLAAAETEVTAELSLFSAYVWRGQVYNDEAVLQPSLTVERGGLGINVWGDFNLTDRNDIEGRFSELDVTLWYGFDVVGPLSIQVGAAAYTFPHSADLGDGAYLGGGSYELFLGAVLDVMLEPSLTVYRDIDASDGLYAVLEISHSVELAPKAELELAFAGGWGDTDNNRYYFDLDGHALNDGNLSFGLAMPLWEHVVVTPSLTYTWLWDSAVEEGARGLYGDKDMLWGGVTVSFTL